MSICESINPPPLVLIWLASTREHWNVTFVYDKRLKGSQFTPRDKWLLLTEGAFHLPARCQLSHGTWMDVVDGIKAIVDTGIIITFEVSEHNNKGISFFIRDTMPIVPRRQKNKTTLLVASSHFTTRGLSKCVWVRQNLGLFFFFSISLRASKSQAELELHCCRSQSHQLSCVYMSTTHTHKLHCAIKDSCHSFTTWDHHFCWWSLVPCPVLNQRTAGSKSL